CVRGSTLAVDCDVYCSSALTAFGVRFGSACNIRATVPDTTGAAMLVPLKLRYGSEAVAIAPARRNSDFVESIVLPAAAIETVPVPGAMRSGFAVQSRYVGPRELNGATASSVRSGVPLVVDAPTVITHGALAGALMPPYCGSPALFFPKFPEAATTTTPASTTRLTASVSGSVQYDSLTAAPTDRLTTRMLYAW